MEFKGLDDREVLERKEKGLVNDVHEQVSRTYKEIIVGNTFTWFNIVLFTLGAILICLKEPMDALFATGILIANILIATIQECKAKRRLDAISLLLRPKVTVIRNSIEMVIDKTEIVMDDIVKIGPGDQMLVDGKLLYAEYLEIDEAVITGESSSVKKRIDDEVYSGTFVIAGLGYYQVTGVGKNTLAYKMVFDAKKNENKNTPLQRELNSLIKIMMEIGVALFFLIMLAGLLTNQFDTSSRDAIIKEITKDAIIALDVVPLALFLMIIISYMVAAIRMADSGVLLQRSNSVESMSHVDVVCMDKTGTITTQNLLFHSMKSYTDLSRAKKIVRAYANSTGSKNNTIKAILEKFGTEYVDAIEEIRFSSDRKFSAVKVDLDGEIITIFCGAKTVFEDKFKNTDLDKDVGFFSRQGMRTLVVTSGPDMDLLDENFVLPDDIELVAVIAIEDEIRPDCRATIGNFIENGIDIKVISGDDPEMVDALFTIAKIPGERNIISGPDLARLEGQEKTDTILNANIFGRMRPEQKEEVVNTLKGNGKYVAMVGDGVNDVKSLKAANVGISLESGTSAAKGVSDMVLIDDNFSALPKALVEGKRTISGMRDLLKVYISRNFTIAVLILLITVILSIVAANTGFTQMRPIEIRTAAIYGFITVSIPAVLMVFWAIPDDNKEPVLPNVLRYTVPMALLIGLFGFALFFGCQYAAYKGWLPITENIVSGDLNNGQGALMMFLLISGVTQILFVQPYYRFFSLDGRTHKDIKPLILVLLLYGLIILMYFCNEKVDWIHELLMLDRVPLIEIPFILGAVVVWFFVARTLLRSSLFNNFNDRIDKGFAKRASKIDEWEANSNYGLDDMMRKRREKKEQKKEENNHDQNNH